MRLPVIIAPVAALSLAACAGGQLLSPAEFVSRANPEMQARLTQFCAADFVSSGTAALGQYAGIYNAVAPLIEREPVDVDGMTQSKAAMALLAVRGAICLATAPAPAPTVVEAVAEASA